MTDLSLKSDSIQTTLKVALHGVTGRMGTNQHFIRSILAIMREGGVRLASGNFLTVEPILVGRDETKLKRLAEEIASQEIGRTVAWSTDLESVITDPSVDIVFDSARTLPRPAFLRQAIEAGKAVYCEKPVAMHTRDALDLAKLCESSEIKNGVVQDKLWLPGIEHLRRLCDEGFFGRILNMTGEFGYWVFTGHDASQTPQRPSWYYRSEDGGGMISDMFCHFDYLIRDLVSPVKSVMTHACIDVTERIDEQGRAYRCTADDAAYAIFETQSGVACQFNSSWNTRVRRDDLLTIQINGTNGSAVAGLVDCWVQDIASTPRPVWNPDVPQSIQFRDGWVKLPELESHTNAFKAQWELFLKHVAGEGDFPWSLRSGARGVALAEAGLRSWKERRWVDVGEVLDVPADAL